MTSNLHLYSNTVILKHKECFSFFLEKRNQPEKKGTDGSEEFTTSPFHHLCDATSLPAGSLFRCDCDILRVLRVTMRGLCADCGDTYSNNSCTNINCKSEAAPTVEAKAT